MANLEVPPDDRSVEALGLVDEEGALTCSREHPLKAGNKIEKKNRIGAKRFMSGKLQI